MVYSLAYQWPHITSSCITTHCGCLRSLSGTLQLLVNTCMHTLSGTMTWLWHPSQCIVVALEILAGPNNCNYKLCMYHKGGYFQGFYFSWFGNISCIYILFSRVLFFVVWKHFMHLYFIFKSFIFRGLETFHAFIFLLKYYRTCGFTWLNFCNLNFMTTVKGSPWI